MSYDTNGKNVQGAGESVVSQRVNPRESKPTGSVSMFSNQCFHYMIHCCKGTEYDAYVIEGPRR
jgi:hypothetical protein